MKSADVKPATTSKSGPGKPFFSGNGGAVAEQEQRPAFFNAGGSGRKGIQAKLTVGTPGDKYERQADATADKVVMKMAENKSPEKRPPEKRGPAKPMAPATDGSAHKSQAPPVQLKCAQCEMKERKMKKEEEKETPKQQKVQRKPIFDSNAEPPPADTGNKHKIQRCAACEGKEMVQKSESSGPGGGAPAGSDLESRLSASKGGGSPLPDGTRRQMESSMGADFSGVRVHTDSGAAAMNKDLHAHAFTHGNDIYFNSGKYDPQHPPGQHLLVHELTHTVQQGAAVQKKPEGEDVPPAVQKAPADPAAPNIQKGWWGDIKDFGSSVASGVGDFAGDVADTVSDAAGAVADKVGEIAGDIKDGIVSAASFVEDKMSDIADAVRDGLAAVVDFLRDLIHTVQEKIQDAWNSLKEFVADKANWIKDSFKSLVKFYQSPLSSIADAMESLDPAAVEAGWKSFVNFVGFWWDAFRDTTSSILDTVKGLWNGISSFVEGVFDQIESILDSRAFSILPGFVQTGAKDLVGGFRAFWQVIKSGWDGVFDGISSVVAGIFRLGDEFLEKLKEIPVAKIVTFINKFGALIKRLIEIWNNPNLLIDPFIAFLEEKLKNAPEKFLAEIDRQIAANRAKKKKNNKDKMPKRYSLNDFDISLGVVRACLQKWKQMELGKMLKDMVLGMVWPPATIKAIGEAWDGMKKDIKEVWDRLYHVDSLQDFWTNLLHLADIIVIIWRFLNTVAGLLYVYIAVLLIVAGGVIGAIFGAGAGAVPGMLAGAEVAEDLGFVLLFSFLGAEATNLGLQYLILATGLNKEEEQETAFNKIADSIIGLVTAGLLMLLAAIAARIAGGLMSAAKSIFAKLSELLKDTGDAAKGAGEHGGGGPEEKGGGGDKGGDEGGDKATDDASDIDPNQVEEGEVPLEKPLEGSEDGERKMAMDKDGECEVCASPCDKMRKKYGGYIDNALKKLIDAIEQKKISNKAKLQKLKPIEQQLRNKLTQFDKNGNLKPNQQFKMAGEFGYSGESDALGRLERVNTNDLQLSKFDRVSHEGDTPGKLSKDQAGHLIGDRFGGSPELDNLVSQTSDVNLSEFKKIENTWANALSETPPKKVTIDIKVNYKGNSVRPASFDVSWKINGKKFSLHLTN